MPGSAERDRTLCPNTGNPLCQRGRQPDRAGLYFRHPLILHGSHGDCRIIGRRFARRSHADLYKIHAGLYLGHVFGGVIGNRGFVCGGIGVCVSGRHCFAGRPCSPFSVRSDHHRNFCRRVGPFNGVGI